ncbi:unnamed protein product [Rotaria sordida]|uniref:Uncharacterized protein n=1 Tax=Rotaria sordida TaxID=392033 RepID=A0A815F2R3_9BILA|nr:unnamed protein product [Rotaria sordida]CAF4210717.1 unnamed protein product [Rotaria sordida]
MDRTKSLPRLHKFCPTSSTVCAKLMNPSPEMSSNARLFKETNSTAAFVIFCFIVRGMDEDILGRKYVLMVKYSV